MKEELTTKMHEELIGKEITKNDLKIMGVHGAIKRGFSLEEACRRYKISVETYKENYKDIIFKV